MENIEKVVYITGGSRGIGRSTAYRFAAPGTAVIINHFDPDESAADEMLKGLEERGAVAESHYYSVADGEAVGRFIGEVKDKYGRLDVMVNNAGLTRDNLLLRMKEQEWDLVLGVNLKGVFHCIQAAAKIMTKQRSGRIVNVASVAGVIGNAGQANYSASKAGVIGLTKTAAGNWLRARSPSTPWLLALSRPT